jgi:hypothetical protein
MHASVHKGCIRYNSCERMRNIFMGRKISPVVTYEVVESKLYPDHWHAEAIDEQGQVFVAMFSGPQAKERAAEYADWKNGVRHPAAVLQMVRG